jgi:hypothetical protein
MPVYIQDRHTHILLLGKSGTGKSTSITGWWETDHYYRNSKILIDPSGFLAKDCYSISGGLYCSLSHPIPVNPMKAIGFTESQISGLLAECINQMILITTPNTSFTAKMRNILDDAVKYCLKNNRKSLINVRDYIANLRGDGETRDGILARLNFILNDERMNKILCGGNSIDWSELIKKRETFILDCFGMSKEQMIFTGNIVSQGIKNYFRYSRPKEYWPVSLFFDEAHNFVNSNMFDILKEGRKFKISCCLATQDFALIDQALTRVMLNVGNIVSYKLGYREASLISKELGMAPEDLQTLEKYHVAYLTPKGSGIAKAPHPPFFKERKPPETVEPQRKSIKPSWFPLESYQKQPELQ